MAAKLQSARGWDFAVTAATGAASTIVLFWPAPPQAGSTYSNFSKWMIAVMLAVFIPVLFRFNRKRDSKAWGIATSLLLVLSVAVFLSNDWARQRWLVYPSCASGPIVAGTTYLPRVAEFQKRNPGCASRECLLESAVCDPALVWPLESIEEHKTLLGWLYLLGVPLFAACIFCAGQTVGCVTGQSKKPR